VRRLVASALLTALCLALAGCGWLRAGDVSHSKPSGFVLRGYVSVAGAPGGPAGTACQAPRAGVATNDPVLVTDPPGKTLATGTLGAGVLAVDGNGYRCNFPFEIPGVPGGHTTYGVAVDDRPATTFPATELRQDKPAVVPIS
jgi:hypothetical protein